MSSLTDLLVRLQSCRRLINASPNPVRLTAPEMASEAESEGPRGPTLLEAVIAEACAGFDIRPAQVAWGARPERRLAAERIVEHELGLLSEPHAWVRYASVASDVVRRSIEEARARDPRARFAQHSVRTPRRARLSVYECGDREMPSWLLVLPYGIPVEVCAAVASELSRRYHFITFEGPDLLSHPDEFDTMAHGIDESASDIAAVLDHFGLSRAHIAGLCAGAMPVLRFADLHPARCTSLILGNGLYATRSTSPTDFVALVERVGGNRGKANAFFRFMAAQDPLQGNAECPHLTLVPYCNPDLLYMFTTAFKAFYRKDLDVELEEWLARIEPPVLVVVGSCDAVVPPEGSHRIARRIRRSRTLTDEHGTHLSLLREPKRHLMDALLRFCSDCEGPGTRGLQ